MTRVNCNQIATSANRSVVWIDIGAGVNTVRLDNVGLIHGGYGVRMSSAEDDPPGVAPGRPLFLFANDLEMDFQAVNSLLFDRGEDVQISNSYVQGAGATDRGPPLPQGGVGVIIGENWNSELWIFYLDNTTFFYCASPLRPVLENLAL